VQVSARGNNCSHLINTIPFPLVAKLVLETILSAAFQNSTSLPLELPNLLPTVPPLGTREVLLEGAQMQQRMVLLAPLDLKPRCPKHL
jgi:hypothetical protein